jgi:hypothetical protein
MSKIQNGFAVAIGGFFSDLVVTAIVSAFSSTGLFPGYTIALFSLVPVMSLIESMISMHTWGVFYTFGWLFGAFVLLSSGLLNIYDFIYYIALPIILLVIKAIIWYQENFG